MASMPVVRSGLARRYSTLNVIELELLDML